MEDLALELALVVLGFAGAFLSGMLGIGGAMVMIPLLLYVPPILGLPQLNMQVVAGLSMIQVLFATLSGAVVHHRSDFVSKDLVLCMGGASLVGSLAGAVASVYVSAQVLSTVFASLALAGVIMMLLPQRGVTVGGAPDKLEFNWTLAFLMALIVGFIAGMVGAGGAFVLIPLMLYVLRLPMRITIGSSLGIVFLGALSGSLGKIGTGQVVYPLAFALVIGALPGAQVGSRLSKRMDTGTLKLLLTAIIGATAIKMWLDLLLAA